MNAQTALVLEWTIKSGLMIVTLLSGFAYTTLFERRVLARIQNRVGPNRTGPAGFLQPAADGIKLIFKEELIPRDAERVLFILAPIITMVPAYIVIGVIPLGPDIEIFGRTISLSLASNLNVGVLYIVAILSIAVYGVMIAAWASGNKYSLLGGLRASAQVISYELALGVTIVIPILLVGSMSIGAIVADQSTIGEWVAFRNIFAFLAFLIFAIATIAEINRAPFDLPEAEQELIAGYHSEYSGMKFAMFMMTEYSKMIVVSAIAASLFLGGYWGPGVAQFPLLGPLYLGLKILVLLFIMIWIRATLPRIRYDRLMDFGWKIMLPASLFLMMAVAILVALE